MIGPRNTLLAIAGIGPTFGEKFADPAVLPTGTPTGVAFSPAGDALIVTHSNSPFVTAYNWSSAGFGAKYNNPSVSLPAAPTSVDFHPSGSHVFVARNDSINANKQLIAYPWSAASGFGATQQVLGLSAHSASGGGVRTIRVSPDGTFIAVAGNTVMSLFGWTGSAFGSALASRVESGVDLTMLDITSPGIDSNYIAAVGTNFGLWVYPYSGGVLGTRFSQGSGQILSGVDFSPAGDAISWCGSVGGFNLSNWVGPGTGAGFAHSGTVPSNAVRSVAFSPLNNAIAVGYNLSPSQGAVLRLYRLAGGRVSNQFADPAVQPAGAVPSGARSLAFSPSGDALAVVHQNQPFITVYRITYTVP
jgi:WD40 repeat protein